MSDSVAGRALTSHRSVQGPQFSIRLDHPYSTGAPQMANYLSGGVDRHRGDHKRGRFIVRILTWPYLSAAFGRLRSIALIELAPVELKLSIIEIGQLPLYNQDREETPPPEWIQLRERFKAATAVLFVTPEYNRSVPSALNNALDVGSRPYGMNVWSGKPGRGSQRRAGRHRGLRRQPSSAAIAGVPQCPGDAAAGNLYRPR
jgi:hypothetical protein